jgi:hypothetical protein
LAPRQSGKSSLISHIRGKLDETIFKSAFIDLSTFPANCLQSEKSFNDYFVSKIYSAFNYEAEPENEKHLSLKKVLEKIVKKEDKRILIFVDEIDRILHSSFKDSWFGLIRSFFNCRATEPDIKFDKMQFILSGAATVTSLISNKIMSPFNVGKSIELYDFSYQQTMEITRHLEKGDWKVVEDVAKKIYEFTSGSLYLTQLLLEKLWENTIDGKAAHITEEDVEKTANELIIKSHKDIHFKTIYESIVNEPEINKMFVMIIEGHPLSNVDEEGLKRLRITGILNEKDRYRNRIYREVFDVNGPLSLFRNDIIEQVKMEIRQHGENGYSEEHKNPKKKILILSSNPKQTSKLRLDEGVREIEEGLRRSRYRDRFGIWFKWAVRLRDLRRALLEIKPQIVHFIGHGKEDGLLVEDELGMAVHISVKALAGLFKLCSDQVECVILSACYSEGQAAAISEHIDYVIGMRKEIKDETAIEFSVGFYDAISAGKSVEEAFKFGCNAILQRFPDSPEHLIPVLKKRKGLLKQGSGIGALIFNRKKEIKNKRDNEEITPHLKSMPLYGKRNLKLILNISILLTILLTVLVFIDKGEKKREPFDIWAKFAPTGWMGDGEKEANNVQLNVDWKEKPHTAPLCIKINYSPGSVGWAGIYWLNKPDNMGDRPGENFQKMGYKKLTFWARGEKGGEVVEFKAGGINAPGKMYRDSFDVSTGRIALEKEWKQYTIELEGEDLSSVIGGFCWVASSTANPEGLTFYLDDIYYTF